MDRILIRRAYLKTLHYIFFSLSVLSLTAAISFWESYTVQSVLLLIPFVAYTNSSIWLAYFFYKDYTDEVKNIFVLRFYALPYVLLGAISLLATEAIVLLSPLLSGLLYSFFLVNFYYTFVIMIGAGLYLFKPVRRFFEFQTRLFVSRGRELAMRFSRLKDIRRYEPGQDPVMDEMFEEIWSHKEYPTPYIQNLEIAVCENRIVEIDTELRMIKRAKGSPRAVESLMEKRKRYARLMEDIRNYEG